MPFAKGKHHMNWGKHLSAETRKKIGDAQRGRVMSEEMKKRISDTKKNQDQTGVKNPFYGRKHTEETKQKCREARLKQVITPEMIEKRRLTQIGSKSHLWKGGLTPKNRLLRNSGAYRAWRKEVFIRDDYTCQSCGQRGLKLQADHIKPFALFPESRLDVSNGRTLCVECHKLTPSYLKAWKPEFRSREAYEKMYG